MLTYAPAPGSVAARVLERLRAPGAPDRISAMQLRAELGKSTSAHIWMGCERAVDVGLLDRVSIERRTYYQLPDRERCARQERRVLAWMADHALASRADYCGDRA